MTPVNPLVLVGTLLTLASLLGTFFYVQLSQWLRDLAALKQKYELNEAAGTEGEKRALVECKVEIARLNAWPNHLVNLIVVLFVIFVIAIGMHLAGTAAFDPSQPAIALALWVFAILFVLLSATLLARGLIDAQKLQKSLFPRKS